MPIRALRNIDATISKSAHVPPNAMVLNDYFESFIDFINYKHKEQNQLLMVAIASHRFLWIHPFDKTRL